MRSSESEDSVNKLILSYFISKSMASLKKKIDFRINPERATLLICMGVSFLIWVFLKLSKEYETTSTVQIEYKLPPLMEFTTDPPKKVLATVRGEGIELAKRFLFHGTPTIKIDLSQYSKPEVQRNELVYFIQQELNLDVQNIGLNYLTFSIDSTATKKVPVVLDVDLGFQKDFFLKAPIKLSADSVILSGPQKELELVDEIHTELVSCPSLRSDQTREARFNKSGFQNIEVYPDKVTVEIYVEQYTEKSVTVPVIVVNSPDSVQVFPSTINIKCSVGLSKYDALTADQFRVEADLGESAKLGQPNSVPIYLKSSPDWIRSPRLSPNVVDYLVVK